MAAHATRSRCFRAPNSLSSNIASVYPDGFLPHLSTHSYDYTLGAALKGDDLLGWRSNFSLNYGWNQLTYDTLDTLNVSLGPTSPHGFYAGEMTYGQLVGNADLNRDASAIASWGGSGYCTVRPSTEPGKSRSERAPYGHDDPVRGR